MLHAHAHTSSQLSTIETMSGRLRTAPKPSTPSGASTIAGDRLAAADLAIRTTEMV